MNITKLFLYLGITAFVASILQIILFTTQPSTGNSDTYASDMRRDAFEDFFLSIWAICLGLIVVGYLIEFILKKIKYSHPFLLISGKDKARLYGILFAIIAPTSLYLIFAVIDGLIFNQF